MDKKQFSEAEVIKNCILPALEKSGWDTRGAQVRQEVPCTDGRIIVEGGGGWRRGERKVADLVLYHKPNLPIAVIEAKRNRHRVDEGIQQALDYANMLQVPVAYSSNGDAFCEHDKSGDGEIEKTIGMDDFPSPAELWRRYTKSKNIAAAQEKIAAQDYFPVEQKKPRYYQQVAINRVVEAIARGQKRVLLTMATGTGKTYTAFQIIHRLRESGAINRVLFLADRNALIDQTMRGDFRHFQNKMTVIKQRTPDPAYEIHLALYQQLVGREGEKDPFREFSPTFFDLIVVDECHRGSAKDNSEWRAILEYFESATQIGLTATPKETQDASNSEYFGAAVYTYSLKQGIEDGFLAPYKVLRVGLNVDLEGWRPEKGKLDMDGEPVEDRIYNITDYDRNLVIKERTQTVARCIGEFLRNTGRMNKTIIFCEGTEHAARLRREIVNINPDLVKENDKYVMQITGDNTEGKRELDNFINPEEDYPVIATTSDLLSTGVDTQTCKLIVLDKTINSMTKFKQIIGRGTRINEEYGKAFFTIMDFRQATNNFADSDFDGEPAQIKEVKEDEPITPPEVDDPAAPTPAEVFPGGGAEPGATTPTDPPEPPQQRKPVYVKGINVVTLNKRFMLFDPQSGKMITASLWDHAKSRVLTRYPSLSDFVQKWTAADKKLAIIKELEEQGVIFPELREAAGKDADIFDLICHVAFDQPPLTRAERANNVKKRNYFAKYGEQARKALEALLDKYAAEGIENMGDPRILQAAPLNQLGSSMEIMGLFGDKMGYQRAVAELEREIYKREA